MKILLDTNILIRRARNDEIWQYVEKTYFPKGLKNNGYISFATLAELQSFAAKNGWVGEKIIRIEQTLNQVTIVHSKTKGLIKDYVQIDAYSQNKHKSRKLPKPMTARNMGKNDIWIAATSVNLAIPLMSTDRDFDHLDGVFLNFIYLDIDKIRNAT